MDTLQSVTLSVQLVLIAIIFVINCGVLLRLCFSSNSLCIHNTLTTAVILANLLYLLTLSSFVVADGGWWRLMSEQVYCLSQNYVVNAMSMVLLGLLAVRSVEHTMMIICPQRLQCKRNKNAMVLVFAVWLLPQLVYDIISLTGSRIFENPMLHLTMTRDNRSVNLIGATLGSMFCVEELTSAMIDVHVLQYLVLVLPFAIVSCVCMMAIGMASLVRAKRRLLTSHSTLWTSHDHCKECTLGNDMWCKVQRCHRKMVVVDVVLTLNLLWHVIGRPLMLTHFLLIYYHHHLLQPLFLDLGSHFILTISCIFIPGVWLADVHMMRCLFPPASSRNYLKSPSSFYLPISTWT